jgi:hypothetical protein
MLLKMGEIGTNSLFTGYPETFKMLDDLQDQAGSIYHYFGCFFAAYALQRSLVERYFNDSSFAKEIDNLLKNLKPKIIENFKKASLQLQAQFELLLTLQLYLLKYGSASDKEIISLAGVFFEEVIEDHEISRETQEDIYGIASGHAFYQLVSGVELTNHAISRKLFVKFLELVTSFYSLKIP